ncbi:MAG: tripartite tricarboxylate transporter TctB family protein [Deltaproteobacteria bacterium]|nr:tripartite tricarboxylate transporter TctB family protein [Deltaproteobacteria bacterium]MBW2309292.1 tripartite tricarboxylate transporter TctB family protein [Deltaproteobacteria bacterium]
MKWSDIIVGIFLLLFGFHIFYVSGKLEVMRKVSFGGPEFFPRLSASLMMICSVLLIANALRGKALDKRMKATFKDLRWVIFVFTLTGGFVALIDILGFLTSTSIYLLIFLLIVRERRILVIASTAIMLPLFVFLFFEKLMGIPLPDGLLF